MTKADLVEEVIRVADLSKKDAENVVNTVFGQIMEALKSDDKIELRGFGSFRVRRRRSRLGRNPKTGDRVDVPSKRIPYFKPGKELRDLINNHEGAGAGSGESGAET
jgi:integration host factor subunit beta